MFKKQTYTVQAFNTYHTATDCAQITTWAKAKPFDTHYTGLEADTAT